MKILKHLMIDSVIFAIALCYCGCDQSESVEVAKPFTLIVLPDTQVYIASFPEVFDSQIEWIAANKEKLNIVFVVHEGDISGDNRPGQWEIVKKSMHPLENNIPFSLSLGNHDIGTDGSADNRSTFINDYFPYTDFESKPWYGGHMGDDNDNHYCYFEEGGIKFMILTLEFAPRDEALVWANKIVAENPDRQVIVLTHAYMSYDGTRIAPTDRFTVRSYPISKSGSVNDGEEMWEKLVCKHENIFLVLSGHVTLRPGFEGYPEDGGGKSVDPGSRLTSIGNHGNEVHQILANYQDLEKGGNGWLRIMTFVPAENKIKVQTYSTYLDQYWINDQSQFELEYDMAMDSTNN